MAHKKDSGAAGRAETGSSGSSLMICRNKHWRYISSFHGPWLQLPEEVLDTLAHQNFTMPAPRLIDPGVFYDVVKIRKLVDEAAQDAVRASTGVSNFGMNARMDYLGAGVPAEAKLSKERVFKIRQKAAKLLARAFALDEVAASVASMQATSTVEDVGSHVLKREANNLDAKYAHFFLEKIPSREMEAHTTLRQLDEIISSLPLEGQAPPLRTRALVQIYKHQWHGATADLTLALRMAEEVRVKHTSASQQLELASKMKDEREQWQKNHRSILHLKEEDQPRSLELQLLFNRAGVYLSIACENVKPALDGLKKYQAAQETGKLDDHDIEAHEARLEARKKVKTSAKRALKDYTTFLSHLDYTPGLPFHVTDEIMRRMDDLNIGETSQPASPEHTLVELNGDENETDDMNTIPHANTAANALVKRDDLRQGSFDTGSESWLNLPPPKIYPASVLFAEKAPADLPAFPNPEIREAMRNSEMVNDVFGGREAITYHPLLTDALHSVLLCHTLLQTSPTELLRHAYNAARLARIADGYPIFQAARSPARADWIELLRRADNWLGLTVPWQKLCSPAPLAQATAGSTKGNQAHHSTTLTKANTAADRKETPVQKQERIKQESIIDALSDDRVVDEASFRQAVRAREQRALNDDRRTHAPHTLPQRAQNTSEPRTSAKRWAQDDSSQEYLISTERAETIARWIKESPLSLGGTRKRRPAKKRKPGSVPAGDTRGAAAAGMEMRLEDGGEDGPD